MILHGYAGAKIRAGSIPDALVFVVDRRSRMVLVSGVGRGILEAAVMNREQRGWTRKSGVRHYPRRFLMPVSCLLLLAVACLHSGQKSEGMASYYADKFHGRTTASGDRYNKRSLTAAHRTFPFGTRVRVTNLRNNHSVRVVINDRGPFIDGRIIDLSHAAAKRLHMLDAGVVPVEIEILD